MYYIIKIKNKKQQQIFKTLDSFRLIVLHGYPNQTRELKIKGIWTKKNAWHPSAS